MRRLLVLVLLIVIALAAYLVGPPLREPAPRSLTQSQRELLDRVPDDADVVAVIPTVSATYYKARTHTLTRGAIQQLREENDPGLLPLLLGNCDLIVWRRDDQTSYIANPDFLRRFIIRMIDRRVVEEDRILFLGELARPKPSRSSSFTQLLNGAEAHLFVWQTEGGRTFPPIPRPAASTMVLGEGILRVHSVARSDSEKRSVASIGFPTSAMLSAIVSEAPRWIDDLERALPIRISPLLDRGALLALYHVEDRPLFPRPFGVIVFPAEDDARAAELERMLDSVTPLGAVVDGDTRSRNGVMIRRRNGIGFVIESARMANSFVIAFDKTSLDQFLMDGSQKPSTPAFLWSVRLLPGKVVPALDEIRDNRGMRLLARDLSRGADRIYRSARWFESAAEIVSTARADQGMIRLETVVSASK